MGYFQMDNDLFDAIAKGKFSSAERAVLDCLVRFTYGFNRKSCEVSSQFIADYSGCSSRSVQRGISSLIAKKIIVPKYNPGKSTTWKILPPEIWQTYDSGDVTRQNDRSQNCRNTYDSSDVTPTTELSYQLRQYCRTRNNNRNNKYKLQGESTTRARAREHPQDHDDEILFLGDHENVKIHRSELEDFRNRFPNRADRTIQRLSRYMAERGKNYDDHYVVLCHWAEEDQERDQKKAEAEALRRTYDLEAFDDMDFTKELKKDDF